MPFKFVNWFLAQYHYKNLLGRIATRCLNDSDFPLRAKNHEEILDYLREKKATKKEMEVVEKAWNEFRKLKKVENYSLSTIKAKWY